MKQQRPPRYANGTPLTKAERKALTQVSYDNLQQWINKSFILAVRLKVNEIHYERGKDGLTVQFRKGAAVLKATGPQKRYQDKAIPRLKLMSQMNLSEECAPQTGKFGALVDDREWNTQVLYARTRSGERIVVRFTGSKPFTGR
jgi:type II secretory ATPase GspE/PulE/Tfp pilus assembly ATPase PilB-like protein